MSIPDFIQEAEPVAINSEVMERIRGGLQKVRQLELAREELEERLKAARQALSILLEQKLPDDFEEAGVAAFQLAPSGNQPGLRADLCPFYSANIAAKWSEERRAAAFAYLDQLGAGDLVKNEVTVKLPAGAEEEAKWLADELASFGYAPEVKKNISHMTLTAWLKEMVEKHNTMPDLEKIGGRVGKIVRIKHESAT